jgi:uncharacterized protein with PIN domain
MKFLADGMLGKLARWLRMLGQDVMYSTQLEDDELLFKAEKECRILLTRDSELFRRATARGVSVFYVKGRTEAEKLAELSRFFSFPLKISLTRSRCPKCNARIRSTYKELLVGKIEKNTFINHDEFWECLNCGQIYWQGAHWDGIRATLEEAKKLKGSQLEFT